MILISIILKMEIPKILRFHFADSTTDTAASTRLAFFEHPAPEGLTITHKYPPCSLIIQNSSIRISFFSILSNIDHAGVLITFFFLTSPQALQSFTQSLLREIMVCFSVSSISRDLRNFTLRILGH